MQGTLEYENNNINKTNKINEIAENIVKAGAAGGVETVVKVIKTHIGITGVCKQGCNALLIMTENGKTLIKSVNKHITLNVQLITE